MAASLIILPIVLLVSLTLAAASCWGIYALTKQRWVWLLIPVFLVFWLAIGLVPLSLVAWTRATPAARAPPPPPPMVTYDVDEETESAEPHEAPEEAHDLSASP